MAQWLRSLAPPKQDPGLIPSTHMVAYNHLQLQFQGIQYHPWPLRALHAYSAQQSKHTYMENKYN